MKFFKAGMKDIANGMEDDIARQRRVAITKDEVGKVLAMTGEEAEIFFKKKGVTFEEPVVLTAPSGTAEAPMKSANDIKAWLKRNETN